MSSTYKTTFLGLNKFVGEDKPKMDDVNFDNLQIDTKIKEHFQSGDIHVTAADKMAWNNKASGMVIGSYIGNDAFSRTISLGFNPSFGVIFCMNSVFTEYDTTTSYNNQLAGFITQQGASCGITVIQNGFTVGHFSQGSFEKQKANFNYGGRTYIYAMFK